MLGLKCKVDNKIVVEKALKNNLIIVPGGENTVRILPPINIKKKDLNIGLNILNDVASSLENLK